MSNSIKLYYKFVYTSEENFISDYKPVVKAFDLWWLGRIFCK